VVVGDGPELPLLRERIPGAAFLGARYGDELSAAYASLDVFVHTGPHETFCQAIQEAMASGLPVLAPDAGGPKDLVLPGRTGYLLPVDREGFATALVDKVNDLRDEALLARLGVKARKVVLGRTWPAVCNELVGHYEAVTGRLAQAA
jgi:phosphatidylinositol alpha 1,6-mannosyltransferase